MQDQLEDVKRLGYANVGTAAGTQNYGTIANLVVQEGNNDGKVEV
jgi:hypothetical protein